MLSERVMPLDREPAATRRRDASGFTLIELLVAIAVTVLLIVPLTGVFIMSIRGSSLADDTITRAGDAQRIGDWWTNDVQNVSVGGVNAVGSADACPGEEAPMVEEQHLISFSWNQTSDSMGAPRTATWVAVGRGSDMELVRRECEAGAVIGEITLAMRVGTANQTNVFDTVRGPETGGAPPSEFCPPNRLGTAPNFVYVSDSCTIKITGSFDYELTVTRRVPERTSELNNNRAPDAPTINDGVGRNGYLTVAWTAPVMQLDQPPVDQYRAYIYTSPTGSPVAAPIMVDGESTSASFSDLTNYTQYWVRVQARNSVGWGPLSDPSDPITPEPTAPDAPTVPSVTPGDKQVTVNWSPNLNDGGSPVTSWHLWVIDTNDEVTGPTVITPGTQYAGVISGLTNGVTYRIKVAGVNAQGEGLLSDFSVAVVPYGIPPAAGVVEAQANESKVELRWLAPDDDNGRPIIGYTIREYKGVGATTPTNATGTYLTTAQANCVEDIVEGEPHTVCTYDHTATNGQYFRYTVATVSDPGDGAPPLEGPESAMSEPKPAPAVQPGNPPYVRPSLRPDKPATPTISVSGTTISVSFTLPANGGEPIGRAFVFYQTRATSGGSWDTSWTDSNPSGYAVSGNQGDAKVVTFTGSAGKYYRVKVTVANKGEWFATNALWRQSLDSNTSNEGVLATKPSKMGAPTISKATGTIESGVYKFAGNVSWVAPSDNGGACIDTYEIRYSDDGVNVIRTESVSGTPQVGTCANQPSTSKVVGSIQAGVATRYFSVRAHNTAGQWSDWSSYGNTQALREVCTMKPTEDTFVSQWSAGTVHGGESLMFNAYDNPLFGSAKNEWSLVRFAPGTSNCLERSAPIPATGVIYGGPAQTYGNTHGGGGSTNTGGGVTMEAYQASFPNCTFTTNSNQKAGVWAAKDVMWTNNSTWNSNRPAKGDYEDQVSGGQSNNQYRWWALNLARVNAQRTASTRFGYIIAHNGGDCGNNWQWHTIENSSNRPALLNTLFY